MKDKLELIVAAACIALLLAIIVGSTRGCGVGDDGTQAIQAEGFTEVRIGDPAPWACGRDDAFGSYFTATDPLGVRVSGVVCCGFMKACTVRF